MVTFSENLAIGIVIERRLIDNAWIKEIWQPIAVLPASSETDIKTLRCDGGICQYFMPAPDFTLHRSDVASYRYNLASERPAIFVALRKDESQSPIPWQILLVTAAPDEAQKLMDSGDDLIEAVAMPESIRNFISGFVDKFPPDEPFEKRQRKNWRNETGKR